MAINDKNLDKLAKLSMLFIEGDEKDQLKSDLNNILSMIDLLQNQNTDGITPLKTPIDTASPLRPDVVCDQPNPDYYQQQASDTEEQLYLVPKVIE